MKPPHCHRPTNPRRLGEGRIRALACSAGLAAVMLACAAPVVAADHSTHAASANAGLRRSEVMLQPADVAVQLQDGKRTDFRHVIDDGRPVMLNFIYTSCTAICPVTSQVFTEVRERLGKQRDAVNMVSVSIDPEYDTPPRLAEYARRFGSSGTWTHVTASQADSAAIQKSFNAYQGDKMNHLPVTFLRAAPGRPWIRIDGLASPSVLVTEVKTLLPAAQPASSQADLPVAQLAAVNLHMPKPRP
jgi:protein SCO1/2